ncbi:hypothetical protein [Fructobacillus tropaeoli]|uniref:Uncharacterized protein n=1 Tax=Fructobacillus tropaeoli TaxID=709323 RepID=A0A3F3HBR3_9LACO|nr:hypothetical protein [Fructobacillus tropaeoli]GAP04918.1 hypothetical protein FTRO_0120260 [Fructobacillus tropaeoli]
MKTKIVQAISASGLEKKLDEAILNIEQQGQEIVSVTPWSVTYRALILYK